MGYSAYEFGAMIGDSARMDAYSEALSRVVTDGSVVLDIGAGTGIFSFLCCKLGASKVYAIEPNEAMHLGKRLAQANGFGDRIEWFQELSTKVKLPEKVDVIVSDLRGVLPFYRQHIPSIIDARERFLSPEGVLISSKDTLRVAIATDEAGYAQKVAPWKNNEYGFDFSLVRKELTNGFSKDWVSREKLLSDDVHWCDLDYRTITSPNVSGTMRLEINQSGMGHGFYVWFDATLLDDVGFSGGPGADREMVYGCTFFPWDEPVRLEKGDSVAIDLRARLVAEDYLWTWGTEVYRMDAPASPQHSWHQSTGEHLIPSPAELRKSVPSYHPQLSDQGELVSEVLRQISQNQSTGQIVDWLVGTQGDQFPARSDASQFLANKIWSYVR
jgi:protein arginine N-methyltransferase 1